LVDGELSDVKIYATSASGERVRLLKGVKRERFDAEWYLVRYPDIALAGVDAFEHFLDHGLREGRKPNADDARSASSIPVTDVPISCLKKPVLQHEVALFSTFSRHGKLKPHVRHYLDSLNRHGISVILIVHAGQPFADCEPGLVDALNGLFVRDNRGYDFAAWAHVFRLHPELFGAKTLYLLNDSVFGPTNDAAFADLLTKLRDSSADLLGLTECFERTWHISSYFLALKSRALASVAFRSFVDGIVCYSDKEDVINQFEITLADRLRAAGLHCEPLFPAIDAYNSTIFHWKRLLESGFPFLKVMTVRDAFSEVDTSDWREVLSAQGYEVSLAERTLAEEAASSSTGIDQAPEAQADGSAGEVSASEDDPTLKLHVDRPALAGDRAVETIRSSLQVEGWALARDGVEAIDVWIDGENFGTAIHGLRRDDVGLHFPDWEHSRLSGYTLPTRGRALTDGKHLVRVELRSRTGRTKAVEFEISVNMLSQHKPWMLRRKMPRSEIDLRENMLSGLGWRPFYGILLAIGEGDSDSGLDATLQSLREQAYEHWHLAIARRDGRIPGRLRVRLADKFSDLNEHISFVAGDEAVGFPEALTRAGGGRRPDLVGILSAGDMLACDALQQMAVSTAMHRDADFFYGDERRLSPTSRKVEAFFKPQWSPDLLFATNYIGRFWCAVPELLDRVGASLGDWHRFGEYDLVLRCTEEARNIQHVPRVLCERGSPQIDARSREREALARAMARRGIDGDIKEGCAPGYYRVRRRLRSRGMVSVIIPTTGNVDLLGPCLAGLLHGTNYPNIEVILLHNNTRAEAFPYFDILVSDPRIKIIDAQGPFNYSRICNLGAAVATGEYLLFLNDDIEVTEPDWVDAMVQQAERPEVGIVGARLLYPDGRLQHAGMFWLAGEGGGRHSFRFAAKFDPGYFGLAATRRNVLMVTGACMMMRRERFEAVGRFDENHSIVNNDVDLCLRCWSNGDLIVYEPAATLIHHELASRRVLPEDYDVKRFWERWGELIAAGDPYYHPSLSLEHDDYSINVEPVQLFYAGHPLFSSADIRRILAVKLDHIGDLITSVPALNRLKSQFPHADLYLLASPANCALARLVPGIREVFDFEFFFPRSELGRQRELTDQDLAALEHRLAPYRFDLAIDLREHFQTRKILRYTGARWLAGYDCNYQFPWLDIVVEQEQDHAQANKRSQIGDDLCRLVDAVSLAANPERRVLRLPDGERPADPTGSGRRLACVHPGVGDPTRQWPARHFAALIDLLVSHHDLDVVLIGGADEAETAAEVLDMVTHKEAVRSLVGTTRLTDLPGLLASAALFVGNNSGPNHIAAGLGIPTIGVYSGVVDARQWGAIGPNAVVVQRQMRCGPCYLAKVADCSRGMACMTELHPSAVYEVCKQILWTKSNGSQSAWTDICASDLTEEQETGHSRSGFQVPSMGNG